MRIKRSISTILCGLLALCFPLGACTGKEKPQEPKKEAVLPGIVCWGDSLTFGTGGSGVNYPNVLRDRISEELRETISVVNLGIGGETSATICARAGVYAPLTVTEEVTIPAETEKVEIFLNQNVLRSVLGESGINNCSLNGVEGKIDSNRVSETEWKYYFQRSERGTEQTVLAGTQVVTYASVNYKEYASVIFIGQNGGWEGDPQVLIAQQRALIERQTENADKFLVLGLTSGSREERGKLERALRQEFGDKFVNLREYLSNEEMLSASGMELNEKGAEQTAAGIVPDCLRIDGVHFNAKGYEMIGNYVFERMNELGYFEKEGK